MAAKKRPKKRVVYVIIHYSDSPDIEHSLCLASNSKRVINEQYWQIVYGDLLDLLEYKLYRRVGHPQDEMERIEAQVAWDHAIEELDSCRTPRDYEKLVEKYELEDIYNEYHIEVVEGAFI